MRFGCRVVVASVSHHGFERDEYIGQLRAAGWSAVEIADEVGLSRSQVHRILAVVGDAFRGDMEDDDDPDNEDDTEGQLALLDAEDDGPESVAQPVYYVGEERGMKRYLDANGRSLNPLGFYRFLMYVENELEDRERGERIRADMDRQIEAYEARHGPERILDPARFGGQSSRRRPPV